MVSFIAWARDIIAQHTLHTQNSIGIRRETKHVRLIPTKTEPTPELSEPQKLRAKQTNRKWQAQRQAQCESVCERVYQSVEQSA